MNPTLYRLPQIPAFVGVWSDSHQDKIFVSKEMNLLFLSRLAPYFELKKKKIFKDKPFSLKSPPQAGVIVSLCFGDG